MRERAARSYRVSAFFVAKSVAETIPVVFFSLLSATILYFMFGLQLVASKFFIWELVQTLLVYAALSVGLLIGSSVKDVVVGQIMAPLVGVVFLLFGGNLLNSKAIGGWFIWIQWLSPVNWAYRANMINEFNGLDDFSCPDPTLPCFKNGQQVLASQGIDNYGLWWCCLALVVIVRG